MRNRQGGVSGWLVAAVLSCGLMSLPSSASTAVSLEIILPQGLPFGAIKEIPRSISVAAGFPLTSVEDMSGGFGDVVSNIHMANAFKRRYPEMRVQLVVWLYDDPRPGVTSVEKIINATLPSVDTSKHFYFKPQTVNGVEVYVIPHNGVKRLLDYEDRKVPAIPKCDLAVQYSANKTAREEILSATGKRWFSFYEPGSSSAFLNNAQSLGSGFEFTGIYPITPTNDLGESRRAVAEWFAKSAEGVELGDSVLAYAYTKHEKAAQNYQRAVAALAAENPDRTYVIAVKKPYVLRDGLGPNVKVVGLERFPASLGIDLIAASDLPPLVTGDSSFATAALTTRSDRAFLYEVLPWKKNLELEIGRILPTWLSREEVSRLYVRSGVTGLATEEKEIGSMLRAFKDKELSRKVHAALRASRARTDLVGNTLKMNAFLRHQGSKIAYLRFTDKPEFLQQLVQTYLAAKDGPDFVLRASNRLRRAKPPVNYDTATEVLTAAGIKMYAGAALTDAEQKLFLSAVEAFVQHMRWSSLPILESYAVFLSENPLLRGILAQAKVENTLAYDYRNALAEFWSIMRERANVKWLESFAEAQTDGCGALLRPSPFSPLE